MKCISHRIRAIDDNEKAIKRQSILDSAGSILAENTDSLPSVISIAKSAGLAKGTVYLYFKTKEEIFLSLLSEQYESLLKEILQLLQSDTESKKIIDELIETVNAFITEQPTFMPLACMANSVIEKNVDDTIVSEFKLMLVQYLERIGASLNGRFPQLSNTEGTRLLLHTNAMIIGLWQMQNWPEKIRDIINQPEFKTISPDFFPELSAALRSLWFGSLQINTPISS